MGLFRQGTACHARPLCLTCGREYEQVVGSGRGCCAACYGCHKMRVRRGNTTWADLEAKRLVLPPAKQQKGDDAAA
jgi:hypothetical protein